MQIIETLQAPFHPVMQGQNITKSRRLGMSKGVAAPHQRITFTGLLINVNILWQASDMGSARVDMCSRCSECCIVDANLICGQVGIVSTANSGICQRSGVQYPLLSCGCGVTILHTITTNSASSCGYISLQTGHFTGFYHPGANCA